VALNQVAVIGPRAETREPEKQEKDWWEKVMEGLQIAKSVTGIATDVQQYQKNSNDLQAQEDKVAGRMAPADLAELQKTHDLSTAEPPETPLGGVVKLSRRGGEGQPDTPLFASIRKKAEPQRLTKITRPGPDGKPVTEMVPLEEGKTYPVYEKPEVAKSDSLSPIEYGKAAQSAGDKFRDDASKPKMAIDAAGEAENLVKLAQTNPAAAAAAVRKLARASGDSGVMSDSDVQAFGGSQAMTDTWNRMFERAKNGTMTDDDVKYATEVAQVLKSNAQTAYDGMADDAVSRFEANFGGKPDDIYKRITGRARVETKQVANPAGPKQNPGEAFAGPADGIAAPSVMDIEAELARRAKAGDPALKGAAQKGGFGK
jgi:hypothetical protein